MTSFCDCDYGIIKHRIMKDLRKYLKCKVQSGKCKVQSAKCKVQSAKCKVQRRHVFAKISNISYSAC